MHIKGFGYRFIHLGKWNKIHFLGLEGPSEELMIPNNVKQELKLW